MHLFSSSTHFSNRGFSLIELLVAVSIFMVVVIVAVGSVMTLLDINLKTKNQQLVFNNINFAVESMVREVREGSGYSINSASELEFINDDGETVFYRLINNGGLGAIEREDDDGTRLLTPDNLDIQVFTFETISYSGTPANESGKILLNVQGVVTVGDARTDSNFAIQTTITKNPLLPAGGSGISAITPDLPYCPIPANLPGLVLIQGFEESKTDESSLWANRYIGLGSCFTGSAPFGPPYNIKLPQKCGCSEQFHPGHGGDTFCPGYDATVDQSSPFTAGSYNRWRHVDVNGHPGLAWNELIYPAVGETIPNLPAGQYDVILAAWDRHCALQEEVPAGSGTYVFTDCTEGLTWPGQHQERIHALLHFSDSTTVPTIPTTDIPSDENFNATLDYVASFDTTASGAQLNEIEIFHAGCVTHAGGSRCDTTASGGSYFNSFGIETNSSGVALDTDGNSSPHSVVPACMGFVCTGGPCMGTGFSASFSMPGSEI